MKPSEQCKEAGLSSLNQLAEITGESIQTLNNWSKNKPKLFKVVIDGAVSLNLKEYICCYAREEMGTFNFESDDDVIRYFSTFADGSRKPIEKFKGSDPLRQLASNNRP